MIKLINDAKNGTTVNSSVIFEKITITINVNNPKKML